MPNRLRTLVIIAFAIGLMAVVGAAPGRAQQTQPPSSGDKAAQPATKTLSEAEKRAIEDIVRDFILRNPEIIVESVRGLQEREKIESRERAQENLKTSKDELLNDPNTPVGGNLKGDVTIVEFFDYRCGFCKKVRPDVVEAVKADKNVRMVYKEFPILGPESVIAARVALAAWLTDKGKYEAFHAAAMGATGAFSESRLLKIAAGAGLDAKAVKKAMDDPRIDLAIQKNYVLAEALDIKGTPAFVIGDQVVRGAIDLDTIKQLIARARGS